MNQPSPEEFLEACGARGPLTLEIERPGQRETVRHMLALPFAVVGRDERADVRLDDRRVNNRQAYLQVAAGRLWCVDLNSPSSTQVQPGYPASLLQNGQELRIDPFRVRLVEGGRDDEAAALANPLAGDSDDPATLPRVGLDFLEGTASQPLWMVDRVLTLVGRAAHCKVRLHSPTVSRTHCALLHTSAGLWVIDLLGREGVHVNGSAVRWACLEDGDEVRIGQFLVRLRVLGRSKPGLLPAPRQAETERLMNSLPPAAQALIPSANPMAVMPADLEGLLSALQAASTPSIVTPAGSGGAAEALLLPMIRQFSLMQQQMFDQFQQALLMMVQMFRGLHRDQLQLIRQELSQLSDLTRELQSLQTEQVRQTPAPMPTHPPRQQGNEDALQARRAEQNSSPPPPCPSRPPEKTSPTVPEGSDAPPAENAERASADVHVWLAQRLATLQQERQSRWQKILSVLTGK